MDWDWRVNARPNQLPPKGDWFGWLILAGRGYGKTRMAAEFVRMEVEAGRAGRIALISETSADGRDVMAEGESGILERSPPWNKPVYEPSKRRLTWKNGAVATFYDATKPDQLRGPQHDLAVLDELAKYRYGQAVFDNMLMGLRLGDHARWIAPTTPRPTKLIKSLANDPHVVVTRGSSMENLLNLTPAFKKHVIDRFAGTRIGRQEIDAEILSDTPGALWSLRNLDDNRVKEAPGLQRIVVGLDPPATGNEGSNEAGIVVAGLAVDKDGHRHGYTLGDRSCRGSPDEWGRKAVAAYREFSADRIIAESNQGGEMVEHVIKSVDANVPVTLVHASRGKYVRAEPVSALYEQGRIHHAGAFPELEDQMIGFTPESAADRSRGLSPDRVDALVWAYSHLFPQIAAKELKPVVAAIPYGHSGWAAS